MGQKAKYSVGQLVELNDNQFGRVEGVITRAEGFRYEVSGQTSKIEESFIKTAYAPVVHRERKTKTLEGSTVVHDQCAEKELKE